MSSVCIDSVERFKDKEESGVSKLLTGCVCGCKSGLVLYEFCFVCSFYSTSCVLLACLAGLSAKDELIECTFFFFWSCVNSTSVKWQKAEGFNSQLTCSATVLRFLFLTGVIQEILGTTKQQNMLRYSATQYK